MKKPIAVFFIIIFVLAVFPGTAFAGSAPTAMSYFTNPDYNKTYKGDDGLNHIMTVIWVGETWNKAGTVIYSINYEDVYQKGGDTYIEAKSTTEIYEKSRPIYSDSPEYSIYQVQWYQDGHKEVISDERSDSTPEQTLVSTPTKRSTETPLPKEEVKSSQKNPITSQTEWVWLALILSGIGTAILLAFFLKERRRKEKKGNEDRKV